MNETRPESASIFEVRRDVLARLKRGHPFFLEVHGEIGSTNDRAKVLGASGAPAWTAVLALRQSKGRGRLGREFHSPEGGVYLSLLLRPDCGAADAGLFTAAAAVAVCRAVSALCRLDCGIKWPNDLLLGGKKVCGILTEAAIGQNGRFDFVVIGVGLNLYPPTGGFPQKLPNAGALFLDGESGASFAGAAAALLNALHAQLFDMPHKRFLSEYRERSVLTGKSVLVLQSGKTRPAAVLGIDERTGLCVKYPDGTEETLLSGEITIREDDR